MRKALIIVLTLILGVYVLVCLLLYANQESIIFLPGKLPSDYKFEFNQEFEEKSIRTEDGKVLNAVLFKANTSKGVIFYLHGNAGSIDSWGWVAQTYTNLNYDVFMLDYRGYGKSDGKIESEEQLFGDIQTAYNVLKKSYNEKDIVVLGYSVGTGLAAKVAADNNPNLLILQAPYYSLVDEMHQRFPFVPGFILKYKFQTHENLHRCNMPVIIFHGDQDEVISYRASQKLQQEFKPADQLITLPGQGHNGMTDSPAYQAELAKILGGQER